MKIVKFAGRRSALPMQAGSSGAPYFLTGEEARRHGVAVGQAVQQGVLTLDDILKLLANCRVCRKNGPARLSDGAQLAAHQIPEGCANHQVLEGLRGLV